jgi:IPT/TIG domain
LKLCAPALAAILLVGCGASDRGPLIQNVGPATIVPGRSSLVVINGENFKDGATVTLGGQVHAASSQWVNANYMTAVLPNDIRPAQYSVEVTNPDGQRAVSRMRVTVAAASTSTPASTPEAKATIYAPTPKATPTSTPTPTPTPSQTPRATPTQPPTPTLGPPRIITPTQGPPEIIPPSGVQLVPGTPTQGDEPRPSDRFRR